jgi:putative transcriptional regulator
MGKTNLINHLKSHRGELSQQALAERVGVSRQTIISIEKGRFRPSVELALRLARALGTTVEAVFALADTEGDRQ